jgi:hypothetical protein
MIPGLRAGAQQAMLRENFMYLGSYLVKNDRYKSLDLDVRPAAIVI